jgi:hypothetical protein
VCKKRSVFAHKKRSAFAHKKRGKTGGGGGKGEGRREKGERGMEKEKEINNQIMVRHIVAIRKKKFIKTFTNIKYVPL